MRTPITAEDTVSELIISECIKTEGSTEKSVDKTRSPTRWRREEGGVLEREIISRKKEAT